MMPIIRGEPIRLPEIGHEQLLEKLRKAIAASSPGEPVIFEIPFTTTHYDVMVIWDLWDGVQPDERSDIISTAYSDRGVEIAQAVGVTYDEAMEDHLLPYQIQPCAREGEADFDELRNAMLAEGGISRPNNKVVLRFPTNHMAEAAMERLKRKLPNGYWTLAAEKYYL